MRVFVMLVLVVVFASCVKNKNGQMTQVQSADAGNAFEVVEVIQGNTYTYIRAKESVGEKWMAVSKQEIQTGEVYYYEEGLPMPDFHSKEIDRTFDEIYFVSSISKTPIAKGGGAMGSMGNMGAMGGAAKEPTHSGKVSTEKSAVVLEKQAGEITVEQVFGNRNDYSGKEVEIRGMVVKVNKEVMGKNWIHIQDGTGEAGSNDLTVTSPTAAKVGDVILVNGKVTADRDFGGSYKYSIIIEDAKVTVE